MEQTVGCIEHKRNGKSDSLYSSTIEDENSKGDEISLPIYNFIAYLFPDFDNKGSFYQILKIQDFLVIPGI